jgi:hypothetical protein
MSLKVNLCGSGIFDGQNRWLDLVGARLNDGVKAAAFRA